MYGDGNSWGVRRAQGTGKFSHARAAEQGLDPFEPVPADHCKAVGCCSLTFSTFSGSKLSFRRALPL